MKYDINYISSMYSFYTIYKLYFWWQITQYILSSLNYAFVEYTPLSYINSENFIANIF